MCLYAAMELKDRLKALRKQRRLTLAQLAEAVGTTASTVSRWETGSFPREFLSKLAEFYGLSVDELLGNEFFELSHTVKTIGFVEAGAWRATLEFPPDDVFEVPVPANPKFEQTFGLQVRGRSMDLHYPPGTILICKKLHDMPRDLRSRDHVIAIRHVSGEIEATVKELVIDQDGVPWLWPRSSDPKHQQPIAAHIDGAADDDTAAIHAIVVGALIERP